ncbi:MAG: hypothetical protein KDD02_23630 [Phaeodactylibacter sp.]|nr:hypothetical protein [Phaeodactylibacter sp.]MCB9300371.1 hypothetical protein [Lewinellaceae bacterium]
MKKLLFVSIFLIAGLATFAQSVWVGGAPGRTNDWMEPRNWQDQRVPGWEDNVMIPHLWHDYYPEVNRPVPAIAHLEVEGGARLSITEKGYLPIDGGNTHNSGILLIGTIQNRGVVSIINTAEAPIDGQAGQLASQGDGRLIAEDNRLAANQPGGQ